MILVIQVWLVAVATVAKNLQNVDENVDEVQVQLEGTLNG